MPVFTNLSAYRFASLGDLLPLREELREFCATLQMRGTILLSPEGINSWSRRSAKAVIAFSLG